MNSVVLSSEAFEKLLKESLEIKIEKPKKAAPSPEGPHERQLKTMKDRYEKKLNALHRKYDQDVQNLRKQVGSLQKKLHELKKEPAAH